MSYQLKELRRLLHQQKEAREQQRFSAPEELSSELPNSEPGFERYNEGESRVRKDDSELFAPLYGQDVNAQGLREHIAAPSQEDMLDVAIATKDQKIIDEFLEEYCESVAKQFLADPRNANYYPTPENTAKIVERLSFETFGRAEYVDEDTIDAVIEKLALAKAWTVENITRAKEELLRMGALEMAPGTPKELDAAALLHCQRVAVSNPVGCVCLYLCYAASEDAVSMNDAQIEQKGVQLLHNPAWRAVSDRATLFAFSNCPQSGYHPSPEADRFLMAFCGDRPASFPLLAQAWQEYKRQERIGEVERRRNQPVSLEQIDQLDDEAVERTYHETMRARAERINRARQGQQPADPVSALLQAKAEFERR